jgi:putative DNA primase/helicase
MTAGLAAPAEAVFRPLGGVRAGAGYLCRCPVASHGRGQGDRHPSLSVTDGQHGLMVHCFAGCSKDDVKAALARLDLSREAAPRNVEPKRQRLKTTIADALALWARALPIAGTQGERYWIATRRLPSPPASIRFLPDAPFSSRRKAPALVAAMQAPTREIVAVQLTFLDRTKPIKARVDYPRRIIGPANGAATRLGPVAETLGLAEGCETAHAAMLNHDVPVWSVNGRERLPLFKPPAGVRRLIIFADPDLPGRNAAEAARAAHESALDVEIRFPASPMVRSATTTPNIWRIDHAV